MGQIGDYAQQLSSKQASKQAPQVPPIFTATDALSSSVSRDSLPN